MLNELILVAVGILGLGCVVQRASSCEDVYPELCGYMFRHHYSATEMAALFCQLPPTCDPLDPECAHCLQHWRWHKFERRVCQKSANRCNIPIDQDDDDPTLAHISIDHLIDVLHAHYKRMTNTMMVSKFGTPYDDQLSEGEHEDILDDVTINGTEVASRANDSWSRGIITGIMDYFKNPFTNLRGCLPECESEAEFIPHLSDCGRYYECQRYYLVLKECPQDRVFNTTYNKCLYFEENCSRAPERYLHCRYNEM